MNEKALKTLEYTKIREMLVSHASSDAGAEKCAALVPSSDIAEIIRLQEQTAASLSRLLRKGNLSFANSKGLKGSLSRLKLGSTLNAVELLAVAALCENAGRVKSYGKRERNDVSGDCLEELFDALEPASALTAEIRRCILSADEIADSASPGLSRVRRSIKSCTDRIHSQLAGMLNGPLRTYLQDALITQRDGRYCVPVKSEYRANVPGMIHDQSSTGATIFVEPMAVVKLNNEIRQLELDEQKEIAAVLADLSTRVYDSLSAVETDLKILPELDFIFARGKLALEMDASMPVYDGEEFINLRKARHPLISKDKVVPIDLKLGQDFDLLVVTGPNTGGKTVSLKTLGLLSIMGQCGLHIPAADRSHLRVFEEIFADIGDEQSIEQSLSTFSSHMTNVVSFIEKADENSLVLFDELGAGTDPTEGAALAIAILSDLHQRGVFTMASTHYSELKLYALSTEGVENACCEFDVETLAPTYRLLIGIPGKSNAFAIAGKLGLPDYIIDEAKAQINEQDEAFEDVLARLEANRVQLENERAELDKMKAESEDINKRLKEQNKKLSEQRDKLIQKANEEAYAILKEAKDYADATMRDFAKFGKNNVSAKEMEKKRSDLREKMKKAGSDMSIKAEKRTGRELKASDIMIGDSVRVLSMNVKGTVSTRPDSKGFLFVQMGVIRSKVHLSDLELLEDELPESMKKTASGSSGIRMGKSLSVTSEINLLGKTVDEAIALLDKYLDDAYLAHMPSVRIVHGKGTGALRAGVHSYLKRNPHVKEYALAGLGEGDSGVTIVKFK